MRCRAMLGILVVGMALTPTALSQGMGGGMGGGMGMPGAMGQGGGEGFGFYGVAGYIGYTSTAVPFGSVLPTPGLNLGPNYLAGVVASAGWQHAGPRTIAHINYTLSYNASLRYSSWNMLNNYLSMGVVHEITPRLSVSSSAIAMTIRWDQFFFEPTLLSEVAGAGATYDELVSAIVAGKYTNSQLASLLTGAPVLDSPAATLLYGTRFFTSSARAGATYDISPRLHIHGGLWGARTQHLHSEEPQDAGPFLVPATTTANVTAGLTYDLSPVTTIGLEGGASRSFSHFEDAYITTGVVTVSRALGGHWIVTGRAGTGTYIPVRQTFQFKGGPHYVASGSLMYKGTSQTLTVSYAHTISDTSGLGAASADAASGIWLLHRPGWRWSAFAGVTYQTLSDSALSNLNAWVAKAGIERTLSERTMAQVGTFYGRTSGLVGSTLGHGQLEGVNLMISWSPQGIGL
jgi:hypothetical protein